MENGKWVKKTGKNKLVRHHLMPSFLSLEVFSKLRRLSKMNQQNYVYEFKKQNQEIFFPVPFIYCGVFIGFGQLSAGNLAGWLGHTSAGAEFFFIY